VQEFEERLAEVCGAKYAVALSSGTAALHAACTAAGIGPGDEVITSSITFVATANAVVYCGGTPILADVEADTANIDPAEIEKQITPRTRALLPVYFAGHPAEMSAINSTATKHGLIVIADACHALGATYQGRCLGELADMTVLSFHPVKAITTGEGGAVVTNNPEWAEKIRAFRHHGIVKGNPDEPWHYDVPSLGYNFRLTDLGCALGLSQLKKLDRFIQRRREIAAQYTEAFRQIEALQVPVERDAVKSAYHIYVLRLRLQELKVGRQEVFNALREAGLGVQVHYIPVHLHSYYRQRFGYRPGDFPRAEDYYQRAVTLPLYPKMSDQEVQHVIQAVKNVLEPSCH